MSAGKDNYREASRLLFLCVMWYLSSLGQNVINKHLFTEFPYPTTVSMCHMLAVAILLEPVLRLWNVPAPEVIDRRHFFILVLPLAFGKFFSSVSAEFSILKVSVSFAHTVKATMPIFTVFLSRLVLGEKQTTKVYLALVPIICGVMIATLTELSFDMFGLIAALTSTITFALQNVYSKKALRDLKIHHLRLLLMLGQIGSLMLLPIWCFLDFRRIIVDRKVLTTISWSYTLTLLFFSGLLNFFQNIFAFSVLNLVTPLSYSIANASKRIFVVLMSLIMLKNPVTPLNVIGMTTALLGVTCYNLAKFDQTRSKNVLPMVNSDLVDGRILTEHEKANGHAKAYHDV
ncbi:solute carrier family 35 member E1 [Strongylocentrotus purpuratus]|uniref:Sugar phosphate transporter domain-containing protein n=1 Tax=Strongylocentrotus purpuratus TaxID=7668 RepID=A0A7M7P038_STRPU|nr:solute carrier family 35 member E1-like [Strongylocentrotus purpuratus]XP_790759.3 solute carrier family 35 member E1 [Strongylocentrotus purpuratus]|eukprot:XP_790759.3 PREDICTED: solute carrier family 35 member E1 [Strongylocentrotus purpuratus]